MRRGSRHIALTLVALSGMAATLPRVGGATPPVARPFERAGSVAAAVEPLPDPHVPPPPKATPCPVDASCRPKAVVLDFVQPARVVERRDCNRAIVYTEKPVDKAEADRRGWWMLAQDIYVNPNIARQFSDLLTDALRERGVFQMYSRADLKLYYQDKKDVLAKKLRIAPKDQDAAIEKLNPVMIGRELDVDKVIVGQIVDGETRHNRFTGYFAAVAIISVQVYDVATGQLESTCDYPVREKRATLYGLIENAAVWTTDRLAREQGVPKPVPTPAVYMQHN